MINNLVRYVTATVILLASVLLTNTQHLDNYGQCISPNGERGQCIHLYNCTFIKDKLLKKPLIDDEKSFIRRSQCGYQNGKVLVCCPKNRSETPSPQAPKIPQPSGNTSTNAVNQHMFNYGRCSTPKGERALCIELNRCAVINDLLKKHPLPDEDRTFISRSQCGFIDGTVLVCCPGRYYGIQPSEVADRSLGSDALPEPGICGNELSDRVLGGNVTQIDEFPWMALIGYQMNGKHHGHKCGATLINERYVVTAAHCIHSIPPEWLPVNVRLGEWNTSTDRDCVVDSRGYEDCADPHIDIKIDRVITHEDYDPKSKSRFNDIALIRLSESVKFTDFIRPICLPLDEELKHNNFLGAVMEVAGWGYTEHNTVSHVKLKADLPIATLSDCQKVLKDYSFTLQNTQLCAGGVAGIDSCRGDSGGPLVGLHTSNKGHTYFFLHGIVSFGPFPCGTGPGVYTKVGLYTDWIVKNIVLTESLFKPIRARNSGSQIFS